MIQKKIEAQYENYIHNISRILDCVECQKCRLYGKLQVFGLGTALKIILSSQQKKPFPLIKRNEFIALINTFRKFSFSIKSIERMFERRYNFHVTMIFTILGAIGTFIIFLYCVLRIYEEMDGKIKSKFSFMNLLKDYEDPKKRPSLKDLEKRKAAMNAINNGKYKTD